MTRLEAFQILWAEGDKTGPEFDNAVMRATQMYVQGSLDGITIRDFEDACWAARLPEPDSPADPAIDDACIVLVQELEAAGLRRPVAQHSQLQRTMRNRIIMMLCWSVTLLGCEAKIGAVPTASPSTASSERLGEAPAIQPAAVSSQPAPSQSKLTTNVNMSVATDSRIEAVGERQGDKRTQTAFKRPRQPTGRDKVATYDLATLIKRTEPSVVRIDTVERNGQYIGSGFVVGADGMIVTNHHVIEDATSAKATFANGANAPVAGVLFTDPDRDIAIIKVLAAGRLDVLQLATEVPEKGTSVVAFGAPKGLSFTATEGIVSAVRDGNELEAVIGEALPGTWVQTSTPISRGNSGGPLVDLHGRVIGANSWKYASGENLSFAISSTNLADAITAAGPAKLVGLPLPGSATAANTSSTPNLSARIGIGSFATDASKEFLAELADYLEVRRQEITRMQEEIRNHKVKLKQAMLSGDAAAEKWQREQIGNLLRGVSTKIQEPLQTVARLNVSELKTGQIGHLGDAVVEVFQVTNKDKGEFLGELHDPLTSRREKLIRFNNFRLDGVVDDDVLKIANNLIFEVVGTSTYRTVIGGTNTVFEIKRIADIKDIITSFEKSIPVEDNLPTLTKAEEEQVKRRQTANGKGAASTVEDPVGAL